MCLRVYLNKLFSLSTGMIEILETPEINTARELEDLKSEARYL